MSLRASTAASAQRPMIPQPQAAAQPAPAAKPAQPSAPKPDGAMSYSEQLMSQAQAVQAEVDEIAVKQEMLRIALKPGNLHNKRRRLEVTKRLNKLESDRFKRIREMRALKVRAEKAAAEEKAKAEEDAKNAEQAQRAKEAQDIRNALADETSEMLASTHPDMPEDARKDIIDLMRLEDGLSPEGAAARANDYMRTHKEEKAKEAEPEPTLEERAAAAIRKEIAKSRPDLSHFPREVLAAGSALLDTWEQNKVKAALRPQPEEAPSPDEEFYGRDPDQLKSTFGLAQSFTQAAQEKGTVPEVAAMFTMAQLRDLEKIPLSDAALTPEARRKLEMTIRVKQESIEKARAEYDAWRRDNPDASDEQARAAASRILGKHGA